MQGKEGEVANDYSFKSARFLLSTFIPPLLLSHGSLSGLVWMNISCLLYVSLSLNHQISSSQSIIYNMWPAFNSGSSKDQKA